jgi:methylmalonyl-CoA epimerase
MRRNSFQHKDPARPVEDAGGLQAHRGGDMVEKVDHIGIVARNLDDSVRKYELLLGIKVKEIEEHAVGGMTLRIAVLPLKEMTLELVEDSSDTGNAAEFLKQHGESIHHVAFQVKDVRKAFDELKSRGVQFLWPDVVPGIRGSKVVFFRPTEFNGVYVELVER